MEFLHFFVILLLAYLLGAFPSSIVIGKLIFGKDIRDYGSGNAGGTNTIRVFGMKAGIAVILLDVSKGVAAVLIARNLPLFGSVANPLFPSDVLVLSAGIVAVLGHIWTVFASFRGGKGVATAAGMLLAIYPAAVGTCAVIFAAVLICSGIVSLSSIITAICFPFVLLFLNYMELTESSSILLGASILIALLILFTHRSNIARLFRGEEKRIFGPSKKK